MRAATDRSLRGRVVVAGIGETQYYRHGVRPTQNSSSRLKPFSQLARMPAWTRAKSTALPPTVRIEARLHG